VTTGNRARSGSRQRSHRAGSSRTRARGSRARARGSRARVRGSGAQRGRTREYLVLPARIRRHRCARRSKRNRSGRPPRNRRSRRRAHRRAGRGGRSAGRARSNAARSAEVVEVGVRPRRLLCLSERSRRTGPGRSGSPRDDRVSTARGVSRATLRPNPGRQNARVSTWCENSLPTCGSQATRNRALRSPHPRARTTRRTRPGLRATKSLRPGHRATRSPHLGHRAAQAPGHRATSPLRPRHRAAQSPRHRATQGPGHRAAQRPRGRPARARHRAARSRTCRRARGGAVRAGSGSLAGLKGTTGDPVGGGVRYARDVRRLGVRVASSVPARVVGRHQSTTSAELRSLEPS
jgi:hypothetical protein